MIKICDNCKKTISLCLYPDYCSSGIWCKHCGVNYADPILTFSDLPQNLVEDIQEWNDFCMSDNRNEIVDRFLISIGHILADWMSQYYKCECIDARV